MSLKQPIAPETFVHTVYVIDAAQALKIGLNRKRGRFYNVLSPVVIV
jgi:hypothetical protein